MMSNEGLQSKGRTRYSAFLSYSHADASIVRKLHSKLENYRLPKGLGEVSTLNSEKQLLGKVFRDREDLSAAENLSDAVRAALEQSRALIVVCSPDAKLSQWVDQEIAYFRDLHPDRPVLAAIVRGEPGEAFPASLTQGGVEPLAADLRKQGDGWRLGFLKIVAGLAGVPLDALIERDARRQVRRVTTVTGLISIVALAMAVMTFVALQARDEAEFQRNEAEGLITFMMDELRTQLEGVGRLDVMDGVNARALQYYSTQGDLSELRPESLENWAGILQTMGEDETKKVDGDLDDALAMFVLAHRTTSELYAREPANADLAFSHAQSEYWVGWIAELREDFSGAHRQYEKYRDLSHKLAVLEPGTHRTAMELGWGELNLGIMSFKQRDFLRAGEEFDRAIRWFEDAQAIEPDDRQGKNALTNAYAWRFDTHFNLGEFELALDQRLKSVAIIEGILADEPLDREAQFSSLIASRAVALTRLELGQADRGRAELLEVYAAAVQLARRDAANREWSEFVNLVQTDLAEIEE